MALYFGKGELFKFHQVIIGETCNHFKNHLGGTWEGFAYLRAIKSLLPALVSSSPPLLFLFHVQAVVFELAAEQVAVAYLNFELAIA
uniref:3-oxoacyl-acyl-carrier-protein synthase IIic n=1 Tax=Rhizophora mucronata TaxID=61149 RepID=A0A2P2MRB2_RHIMU